MRKLNVDDTTLTSTEQITTMTENLHTCKNLHVKESILFTSIDFRSGTETGIETETETETAAHTAHTTHNVSVKNKKLSSLWGRLSTFQNCPLKI